MNLCDAFIVPDKPTVVMEILSFLYIFAKANDDLTSSTKSL